MECDFISGALSQPFLSNVNLLCSSSKVLHAYQTDKFEVDTFMLKYTIKQFRNENTLWHGIYLDEESCNS